MSNGSADKKAQLIERITTILETRLPDGAGALAADFARVYFDRVPPEDLVDDDPEDLYGAVLAHWNLVRGVRLGETVVRVYNPTFEEHGWRSTHTVLDLVLPDMPFLVDSVGMELNRHGFTLHRLFHPVVKLASDEHGELARVLPPSAGEGVALAVMHFEIDRETDAGKLRQLATDIERILGDVSAAVEDWPRMLARMNEIAEDLDPARLPVPETEVEEVCAFLDWAADNHFTLLGYCAYLLAEVDGELLLQPEPGTGLGIRRAANTATSTSFNALPPAQRRMALEPRLLVLTKANAHSTVHRPVQLDYIGIKRFDDAGQVIGEWRFLGLFTSSAYQMSPLSIPVLRAKVRAVLDRAGFAAVSHSGKAIKHVLTTYPRDELFQATVDELYEAAMGIVHLEERQRLRLFMRKDAFERHVSAIAYVPRDRYNTELRVKMQNILMAALNGTSTDFVTEFGESVLARVLITVRTVPGQIPEYDAAALEQRMTEAMLSWEDGLRAALLDECGEGPGNALFNRYGAAFTAAYKEDFVPRSAVGDILRLERVREGAPLGIHLYRPLETPQGLLRFKLYGPQPIIALSDVLPMLEKMGLNVLEARPYEVEPRDAQALWVLDFDLREAPGIEVDVGAVREIFQDAFARVWNGSMENDGFNRLVLGAGLAWRAVVMLRAYAKYLLQTRAPFSQAYMEETLAKHAGITAQLAALFFARFDVDADDADQAAARVAGIESALEQVSVLDEDRILRRFLGVILATLRTNFCQTAADGGPKEYLSFKFDPSQVPELPLPRPMFEIFVYSPRAEAVHLRFGKVARGGLRWSDRREDFRTEVLGLVKAQQVKNAVIVPVGSKGGFVVKRPPAEREALMAEVVHCYKTLIRGMLDLTDNLVGGSVAPPPRVRRYDADDPYLVVAADKGTATFSDIANGLAREYGFWLDDAFASGGSVGYDHKKMGITARGAWESVKRQFRELDKDIQNEDFSVVGVGDMSGDVFGNGMLLSRHIRLVAAFDHRHIFLDPSPDTATSFAERERLFALPRSSWADYDASLISPGGGIYPRSAKSIAVSPEVRAVLDIDAERLTPTELISAILKAPVELLWNGGIGTYVKSSEETHADAGDRANDVLRVNGAELRCKVVGEGGNLGFTQRGRIEYALRGGRVFTDAIDNSAGVNCSDHEVNIKILLGLVVAAGDMTEKQRNVLLAEMTDEVAWLVLRQNVLQPQTINIAVREAPQLLGDHTRVIRLLEKAGRLNRAIEFLPADDEIAEREAAGRGLTAPEIAVLLAYSKIALYDELLASDVPEDPYLRMVLRSYFPRPLLERYAEVMDSHPLKREIIATVITNSMLNRMGSTFAFRVGEQSGASFPAIARAYTAAREMFDSTRLWDAIEALDNKVPAALQLDMISQSQDLLTRACLWLLRNRRQPLDIEGTVARFAPDISRLLSMKGLMPGAAGERLHRDAEALTAVGVPEDVAEWVASQDPLYATLDVIEVAAKAGLAAEQAALVYFSLVDQLDLDWLRHAISDLPTTTHWQNRARHALLDGLYTQQRRLAAGVLKHSEGGGEPADWLAAWGSRHQAGIERLKSVTTDLKAASKIDLAMLMVAIGEVGAVG
ncbi:glutamate dehydrogenase (NAD) [Plasticicumulans lactativorans]|uniref:Glutamate dehydrogenase (NAD) n=1 Tax=Plasticicumulans lactativorans TaxID=1133106 RepID=A0A4R2KQ01_9GAMM|nr:NAD-glutamate dehydrogenase [Plasticicumulans lactativorans]TCO76321.1 glutamate dehydrogenase (NAD) [Plasticicumulans lactativorans]